MKPRLQQSVCLLSLTLLMVRGWLKSLPPQSLNPHGAGPSSSTFCGMALLRSSCFPVPLFVLLVFHSVPRTQTRRSSSCTTARISCSSVSRHSNTDWQSVPVSKSLLCVSVSVRWMSGCPTSQSEIIQQTEGLRYCTTACSPSLSLSLSFPLSLSQFI